MEIKIDITGFEEFEEMLKKLEDPKPINSIIQRESLLVMREMKKQAPDETGRFAGSIKRKKTMVGRYSSIIVTPAPNKHGSAIYGYTQHGTGQRYRIYKDKSAGIKFKRPASTGKFTKREFATPIRERSRKRFIEKVNNHFKKIGGN